MSNIAGKAYGMNVLTPVPPWLTWLQVAIFMTVRALPAQLRGLLGLKLIHFARWVVIRRADWPDLGQGKQKKLANDYVLFVSNFNGTWDQYIDAFADGLPSGLDLLWYASTKYPHSIPISSFKAYISANQFDTSYYYVATPGSAQRDIKAALRVRAEMVKLTALHASLDPAAFAVAYKASLDKLANSLASPGFAPIASLSTQNADLNRRAFINDLVASRGGVGAQP
jgi:hypothetical protein